MKFIAPLSILILASLVTPLFLTSCASNSGGMSGDGTYTAPPSLSPVDSTDRMRSEYREWIR